MDKVLITNGQVITKRKIITPGALLIEGERILEVGSAEILEKQCKKYVDRIFDVERQVVAPGFIDIHVHGGGGAEAMDGTVQALKCMAGFFAQHGVTGFLPTIQAAPKEDMIRAIQATVSAMELQQKDYGSGLFFGGAQILGLNVEGPFLNPSMSGAQMKEGICSPDISLLRELIEAGQGRIKIMTLAPELDGAEEVMEFLHQEGVIVAVGHSNATFEVVGAAVKKGLSHITHIFNAMRRFHHREPGVAGAALTLEGLTVEVIADGVHVHPAVMRLLTKVKGSRETVLVTDAIRAAGLSEGRYAFGRQEVLVKGKEARLASGVLAGSVLTMEQAVANMVEAVGIELVDAIAMASATPAKVIGLDKEKGSLEPGKDADIVVLSRDWEVLLTMVKGKEVYSCLPGLPL